MASKKIKGITIEIGADATGLKSALKSINSALKNTQDSLKDVNKLLKLDPTNTELLRQKQELLNTAVEQTEEKLKTLKKQQEKMDAEGVDKNSEEYQALTREIIATENALKDAEKAANKFNPALEKIQASAKNAADGLKTAADKTKGFSTAAAGALASLLGIGYKAVTNADDLNTLAKQTGFTTEELQKMSYAADRIDVSMEDITGAMKKFKTRIDPTNKALQQLGVSVLDSNGNLRSGTDVFWDAIKALSSIQNETEKDQLAMDLFGKSADSLAGIIDDGGEAFTTLGDEAEGLGLILNQDTLDSLNETNDAIDTMKAQIAGIVSVIGSQVVPVVAPIVEQIGDLITGVAEKLSTLNPETMKIILVILAAVAALTPLLTMLSSLATAIAFLASPIGIVIAIATALIAVGVLVYKNWDKIKGKAVELGERVRNSWNNLKTAVGTAADAVRDKIETLKDKFETLKEKVVGVWDTIKRILSGQISLPHIPLPHFSINPPGWKFADLLQGSLPSLGITWYKKAYDNPVVFTSPTVVPTANGLKGFGDGHGAEIVMGLDRLREVVGSNGPNVTINVYAPPGMDVDQLASKIQQKYVAASNVRRLRNA